MMASACRPEMHACLLRVYFTLVLLCRTVPEPATYELTWQAISALAQRFINVTCAGSDRGQHGGYVLNVGTVPEPARGNLRADPASVPGHCSAFN